MQMRIGYELSYRCPKPTPMILTLNVHYSRVSDMVEPDHIVASPAIPLAGYRDAFGNWCSRIVAPQGALSLSSRAIINDTGDPDVVAPDATQHAVEELPGETLVFLLGSRYCETDLMSEVAWQLFERAPSGWARVQAICDFAHGHIAFGYEHARATRTAFEAYRERVGVCRDYAHTLERFEVWTDEVSA